MRESAPEADHKIIAGMGTSIQHAIKWLVDEQQPHIGSVYGSVPSAAIQGGEDDMGHLIECPCSESAFQEVEDRIDAERRKKHAKRS